MSGGVFVGGSFEPVAGKKRGGRQVYRVVAPGMVYLNRDGAFSVPPGYETDFVSAAAVWRAVLPKMRRASCLHDMLCQNSRVPLREADRIFREAMKADRIGWYWRFWVWAYVRLRGTFRKPVAWDQPALTAIDEGGEVIGFVECGLPTRFR